MVERTVDHPGWDELLAYSHGRLDPEFVLTLEEHLADCMRCCELLETAPGDTFLNQLRDADSALSGDASSTVSSVVASPAIPAELIDHPRYRVLGLIGQGGMGAVYQAEHRRMERLVALKVIRPGLMRHTAAVQRFHQEARAAARLQHAHIVTAYDADQAGELHFLVMEYIEGRNLADYLAEKGSLSVTEACEYIRQAALGLQHAHERGMVHRDIKPHNLMLQADAAAASGIVKILDFGLARLPRTPDCAPTGNVQAGTLTDTGTVMGTADYIAPEQAANPRGADIRADIYALGCTLFHLLTGRPPFPAGTVAEKLARHAEAPFPSLTALRPETPPGLAVVLARMTAKAPADRYATPAEVADALTPFCPPVAAHPVRPRKRGRWLVAGLMLVALLSAVVVWRFNNDHAANVTPIDDTNSEPIITGPEPIVREKNDPKQEMTETEAIRLIQKLGGRIIRGNPINKSAVTVDLAGTKVTNADLPALTALKALTTLKLDHTGVTDQGLTCLAGLPELTELALTNTKVTDAGMKPLAEAKQLRSLALQHTAVGDAGIKHLAGLSQLHSLLLYGRNVTDAGMADLGRLHGLSLLRLDNTAITDAGLRNLTGLTEMRNLGLNLSRKVGDDGMKSVAQFKRLIALDLAGTRVTDRGLQELSGLKRLNTLQLGSVRMTDVGAKALKELRDLHMLSISNADISDEGLKELAKHRRLMTLNLQGVERITDAGVMELAGLSELKLLILSRTNVSEAAVAELQKARPKLRIVR
ncbi:MAG TPA: protein kinase [Gemmataceae bacterium]|nr:protein kinase [Gemmataceae bacterium]